MFFLAYVYRIYLLKSFKRFYIYILLIIMCDWEAREKLSKLFGKTRLKALIFIFKAELKNNTEKFFHVLKFKVIECETEKG